MLNVIPNEAVLGATIAGVDLSQPLGDADFAQLLRALGQHVVLRFPGQTVTDENLRDFSARFGAIQGSISREYDPRGRVPEVSVLSNIRRDGQPIGLPDAGQDWHTDMSYRAMRGFVNILYGITIPFRTSANGEKIPVGGTEFSSMHAVWRALPEEVKRRLRGATATHDYNKLWEHMRRNKGSTRGPLTAEQRAQRPPVSHPIVMIHPITGTEVLYCDPGYTESIDGWDEAESARMLEYLFACQLRPEFRYTHVWTGGDVLIWDNLGSIHRAVADYGSDQPRLIRRCQVLATEVFTPAFQQKLQAA